MNIILPKSIYTAIFAMALPIELKKKVIIKESSLIASWLAENKSDIGFLPSLDLLKHNELFVSKKFGISFEGTLSNAYFYFVPEQKTFNKILVRGDLSSNDLILSKILFPELFGIEPEFTIDSGEIDFSTNNYLISGIENEVFPIIQNGISAAEQIIDLIDFPYVNFVVASQNEESIKSFEKEIENIDDEIEKNIKDIIPKLKLDVTLGNYINNNFHSVYYKLEENDVNGLTELIKLPYYHGIVDEIIDIKFVENS